MVEATPADQNLLDVELPEETSEKSHDSVINEIQKSRKKMTFEPGKLIFLLQKNVIAVNFPSSPEKTLIGWQV